MKSHSKETTTSRDRVSLPLSYQAAFFVIIVFILTTWLLVWRMSKRVNDELYSQIETRGRELVSQMAVSCTRPLVGGDLVFVESTARDVGNGKSVIQAAIITYIELYTSRHDRKKGITDVGSYVAHSDPEKIGTTYELPEGLDEADVAKEVVELVLEDGCRHLRFRKPMIFPYKGKNRIVGAAEIIMDLDEISEALRKVRFDVALSGSISAAIGAIGIILLFNFILRPIKTLTVAMSRIKEGNFKLQVIARDPSEVGLLTRSFNSMAAELDVLQRKVVKQEIIKKELDIAETIQQGLLPDKLPSIPGLDLAARYEAAEIVGGDYYDVFRVGGNKWAMAIGDVSGKGIPGSLVMTMTRSILRSQAEGNFSPAEALIRTNRVLCQDIPPGMFVTMALAYYDQEKGVLTIASAGHNPVIVFRKGKFHQLKLPGLPLGADDSGIFEEIIEEGVLTLKPEDLILMYTDGITEAMNRSMELFGIERLKEAIQSYREGPIKNFPVTLMRRIDDFRTGASPNDDLTFIVMRRLNS